jgi:hypothetical protein
LKFEKVTRPGEVNRKFEFVWPKCQALEWIPYDRFYDIKYIAKGGFGKIFRARWIDGCVDKWDNDNKNWGRKDQNMFVALKSLNNSKNVKLEFMNEVNCLICLVIT